MDNQSPILIPAVFGQPEVALPPHDFFGEASGMFPWFAGAMLAFESCEVIRLRLTKMASGDGAARDETHLMMSEKLDAAVEAGMSLMTGASAASIVGRYREHVAANVKRLSAV